MLPFLSTEISEHTPFYRLIFHTSIKNTDNQYNNIIINKNL